MKNRPRTRALEQRVYDLSDLRVELRAADGEKPPVIEGTTAVYNRWSQDLGGFKERILPGAFTNTLAGSDIRALFNHDPNIVLGRNKAGTLTLTDMTQGLRVRIEPPETDLVREMVLVPMQRRDVNQMSFAFRTRQDVWREPKKSGDLWERDLVEVEMSDTSVVTFPAYTQTDAAVRSLVDTGGLDLPALSALLTRAERGLPITGSDRELLASSIALLRSYIEATPDEGAGSTPDEGAGARAVRRLSATEHHRLDCLERAFNAATV